MPGNRAWSTGHPADHLVANHRAGDVVRPIGIRATIPPMSKALIQVLATQEDIVHGLVAGLRSSAKGHLAAMIAGGIATTGISPTEAIMKERVL
jgi:hypothetical protein